MSDQQRDDGIVVDLEQLEHQAEELYLHRFVEAVRKARGEHGRYLVLRAGDALAVSAARDGSMDALRAVAVDPSDAGSDGSRDGLADRS